MPKRISIKQKRFVRGYLKHGNGTQAALDAYDTDVRKEASVIASENLKRENVQEFMKKVLDDVGLTDENLADSLEKIVRASTTRKSLKNVKVADGLRGLELAYRVRDRFLAEKKRIVKSTISMKLESKSEEELKVILKDLVKEVEGFQKIVEKAGKTKKLQDNFA